jgi:hypothetical protein
MPRPTKASLDEIPELDIRHAKLVRRGPAPHRTLSLPLAGMRKSVSKTQNDVAAALETDQGEISRLEGRDDVKLSTLRRYAEALGARCEVVFVFPRGQRIVLAE